MKVILLLYYVYYIIFNNTKIKKLNMKINIYSSSPERMKVKEKKELHYRERKENIVGDFNDFSRLF